MKSDRTEEDIIAKVRELTKRSKNATAVVSAKIKQNANNNNNSNSNNNNNNNNTNDNKNEKNNKKNNKEDTWTPEQQKALEKALQEVKNLPANERWDKVETLVPGKSKQQCIDRFKFIRAQILARKQQK